MPLNRPTIAPLAVAYIRAHGPQTTESLSAALGYARHSVGKAMMDAADRGQVVIVGRETVGNGSKRLWYGVIESTAYPRIGAGEYRAWMPSGTRPEDNKRVAA